MKKLTKEDKARRYDEVINRMKHYVVDEYGCSRIKVADVFPELIETDDEKIRKGIIRNLEYLAERAEGFVKDELKERIVWLEKQGGQKSVEWNEEEQQIIKDAACVILACVNTADTREEEEKLEELADKLQDLKPHKQGGHKTTDKIQIGKEYKCIASPRYSTFMTGKIYKPEDKFLCSFMNFCSDCFEPIEDSEQIDLASNTDKVEPKFKNGDRVRNKKSGLEQTLGGCIVDVYEGAFPFRIKDQDEWELVKQTPADKVEPKFKVGDIVQYITDSTDRRKIEEVDTLCNMYHTDSSPIMFEIEDEWKVVVNAEDVEYNPADKIESKFKVGDWIVQENIGVYQVIEVCESWYEVVDNKDKDYSIGFDKEHMLRHWTIADAKDGDVLVDCSKDEVILMFRGIGNTEWDDVIDYHCYYSCFRKAFCVQKGVDYWGNTNDHKLKPATKEQRELLYQKIKEAGYEWDDEYKKLTAI